MQKCLGTGSSGFEHDGQNGKQNDLNSRPTSIPIRSANSILEKKREEKELDSIQHCQRTNDGRRTDGQRANERTKEGTEFSNAVDFLGASHFLRKTLAREPSGIFHEFFTLLATVEDCNKVADQVHWDTIVVAVKPMLTLPPASKAVSRLSAS